MVWKIRKRFSVKKNIIWFHEKLCASKKNGGLGLDLEIMNKTLLAKWLVRFHDHTIVEK
jgi:zinc-binding in reverse transcriptase